MQTMTEEFPCLTRMLSCRNSKKVSCETLTIIDVDSSNIQSETHSFCHSDDENNRRKEELPLGDDEGRQLENPSYGNSNLADDYLRRARELEKQGGKLDNSRYGNGKAGGLKVWAYFTSKTSHKSVPRHAKEAERLRKHLRAYPSAIHGTGGVLPPSSGPILLPIGSHSGGPLGGKASMTLRASSIIPRNAVAARMNPSGRSDPSSPKVTCLGRVRNRQKHTDKCSSAVADDTRKDQVDVFCACMLKRRDKKKAYTGVVESASRKEKKLSRMGSDVVDHHVKQHKEANVEKASKKLRARKPVSSRYDAEEERKGWSMRETAKHEESNISYRHHQKWQAVETFALGASSQEPEFPIDLSRFGWEESQKGHEMMVQTSMVCHYMQRIEQDDNDDSVQAPPQDALLLMRKGRAKSEVSLSSLSNGQETSLPNFGDHLPASKPHECDQFLLQVETKKPISPQAAMKKSVKIADGYGHISTSKLTFKVENASSALASQSNRFQMKFSLPTEYSGVHRQASLQAPSRKVSLWQRRAIAKPCVIDLKR